MLDLLDYRRYVGDLYRRIREASSPDQAWQDFRHTRDDLFRAHPLSPLDTDQKRTFSGLRYFEYDPAYRVLATVDTHVEPVVVDYDLGDDGHFECRRFGQVRLILPVGEAILSLYWIEGYGGGVFLPFGDTTNREMTYGGGRYLLDTIKGADLGMSGAQIVLDLNFAYNPSCAYNPRWVCPLAPPDNRLPIPIHAGEMGFDDAVGG
ncbi:MAG: DUF1684 domain-containing protein [Anaerolineae bacterium]|nr:DUF1684 domain-containing protein [Anaerolineae bacterium]